MTESPDSNHDLTPAQAEALDAMVESGFDAEGVEARLRPEARQLSSLLSLLDRDPATRDGARDEQLTLCAADEETSEILARESQRVERLPRSLRDRGAVHRRLIETVTVLDSAGEQWLREGRADRIARAIAAIQQADPAPIPFEEPATPRRRLRLADMAGIAAVILAGVLLMGPVMGSVRGSAERAGCFSNLGDIAAAFGLYANDHQDALPTASTALNGSWMRVGTPEASNSANLFVLVRGRYADLEQLACPGNEHAPTSIEDPEARDWSSLREVSYSYRLPSRIGVPAAVAPSQIVLADRSPVVLHIAKREAMIPEERSPNHGFKGQHVLRGDGSSTWENSPVIGGDNIWLPARVERQIRAARVQHGLLTGDLQDLPEDAEDVFLGP